jgi:hypothetical protein
MVGELNIKYNNIMNIEIGDFMNTEITDIHNTVSKFNSFDDKIEMTDINAKFIKIMSRFLKREFLSFY